VVDAPAFLSLQRRTLTDSIRAIGANASS
jgi:hypothetical protein